MADERRRHLLHDELGQLLSPPAVDELMSYFPPVGWADVATKADLGIIRSEIDALRAEFRGDTAQLRGEMAEFRGELAKDMADLRVGLQRWIVSTLIAMTGAFLAVVALLNAVQR